MGSEGFPGGLTTEPITELDACQILGVTAKSSRRQIRAAYHRKVSQWHPDRLEQGSEEMRLFATEQMAAINHAYHLLTSD
jgi:curved DNA-binding protein CbpA